MLNLQANVSISPRDNSCIEVVLRCLAVEGDGLGSHDLNDGGILANVMAAGFKGSLSIVMVTILSTCYCVLALTSVSQTKSIC